MKIIKLLSITLLFTLTTYSASAQAGVALTAQSTEPPAKTVFFKHPNATDPAKFFSEGKMYMFEVYKIGTKEDLEKVIKSFGSDKAVENIKEGIVTGDFQAIHLTLKATKDKAWFVEQFRKAGLKTIKINNNPVIAVEKL
jgi:hypothetical protein